MAKARFLPVLFILAAGLTAGIAYFYFVSNKTQKEVNLSPKSNGNMLIISSAFKNNDFIPAKYTCDGDNINPPLDIDGVPEGAQSLALIVGDPDAPRGTWTHWLVWNIDPKTMEISEKSLPQWVIEGKTSFGKPGYGGPCPPSGTHRYLFKLYALDTALDLTPQADKSELEKAMAGHVLEEAELIGLYSHK